MIPDETLPIAMCRETDDEHDYIKFLIEDSLFIISF